MVTFGPAFPAGLKAERTLRGGAERLDNAAFVDHHHCVWHGGENCLQMRFAVVQFLDEIADSTERLTREVAGAREWTIGLSLFGCHALCSKKRSAAMSR